MTSAEAPRGRYDQRPIALSGFAVGSRPAPDNRSSHVVGWCGPAMDRGSRQRVESVAGRRAAPWEGESICGAGGGAPSSGHERDGNDHEYADDIRHRAPTSRHCHSQEPKLMQCHAVLHRLGHVSTSCPFNRAAGVPCHSTRAKPGRSTCTCARIARSGQMFSSVVGEQRALRTGKTCQEESRRTGSGGSPVQLSAVWEASWPF